MKCGISSEVKLTVLVTRRETQRRDLEKSESLQLRNVDRLQNNLSFAATLDISRNIWENGAFSTST